MAAVCLAGQRRGSSDETRVMKFSGPRPEPAWGVVILTEGVSAVECRVGLVGGLPVVTPPAVIDIANADQLREALASAGAEHTTVLVDLTANMFCDSSSVVADHHYRSATVAPGRVGQARHCPLPYCGLRLDTGRIIDRAPESDHLHLAARSEPPGVAAGDNDRRLARAESRREPAGLLPPCSSCGGSARPAGPRIR